jgi:hypothetical protein
MDAIEWQVPQVKRKNSTSCSPPDASETVSGFVAWRLGPSEVGTTWRSTAGAGGIAVASGEDGVADGAAATGADSSNGTAAGGVSAGAQEDARSTASRLIVGKKRRDFIVILLFVESMIPSPGCFLHHIHLTLMRI